MLRSKDYRLLLSYDYEKDGWRRIGYEVWIGDSIVAMVRRLQDGRWCAHNQESPDLTGKVARSRHRAIQLALPDYQREPDYG